MMRVSVVSEHLLSAELAAAALRVEGSLEIAAVVGGVGALDGQVGARALKAAVVLLAALVPADAGLLRRVMQPESPTSEKRRTVVVADLCGCIGVTQALQWGARGYVGPWERADMLAPRVLQAGQGRLAVPPGSLDGVRLALRTLVRDSTAWQRLSEADLAVMRALSRGESTGEVAARLNVTESVIRHQIRRMIVRLEVRNENELSALAASAGLYERRAPAGV